MIPSLVTYSGIPYNASVGENGTIVGGIPVLFNESDFEKDMDLSNSIWYASRLEIFPGEGHDGNATLLGNYVNRVDSATFPGAGTMGLAKCEAYLNGKKCSLCKVCASSPDPLEVWRVSDKTGAYFDCSEHMDYCVGSSASGLNDKNIVECQEFTQPGFGACFEAYQYTPPPTSTGVVRFTASTFTTVIVLFIWVLM